MKHYVYRAFDENDRLLYVGFTGDFKRRKRQHELATPWFPLVARWTFEEHEDRYAGLRAEHAAITSEMPEYNVQPREKARRRLATMRERGSVR